MKPKNQIPDSKNQIAFDLVELAIQKYKKENPFVIGITGAGGAGKTTFGNNIMQYYGFENCISIDLDDYLISRKKRGELNVTGYDPKANQLEKARQNITDLKLGKQVSKPVYDHSNGETKPDEIVVPRKIIVIEGVTTLYPELADMNDVSFFLDALEETQIQSRIERDVKQRGYTLEQAMALFKQIQPDYKKFIKPTKNLADVVFSVGTDYVMKPILLGSKFE